ncbi:MAG: ABC transporter permease [Dehalococcoidia bacterium]
MVRYLTRRLLSVVLVAFLVSLALFAAVRILPGDLAEVKLGEHATPEDVQILRTQLGLDDPLLVQYGKWIGGVLRGDPGDSLFTGRPVFGQLWSRLPVTIELSVLSLALAMLIGIPLGVISALRSGSAVDYIVRIVAVLGQAVPNFWLGIVLLTGLGIYLQWTPPVEYRSFFDAPLHNIQQFALPAIILGYGLSAIVMRLTRSMMLEVLRQDYIRTARSKGLAETPIVRGHALKNTLIPVVTVLGTQFGFLIGGSVVIEQIFALPGVGRLTLEAIVQRDYPQLQFNVLFLAVMILLLNLAVDLLYAYLDPRIRFS